MKGILTYFYTIPEDRLKSVALSVFASLIALFFLISFFSTVLAMGLFLVLFLCVVSMLIFYKAGVKDKNIYIIFLIALLIHVGAALFIYYSGFGFGGGEDFTGYHQNAIDVSGRLQQGNFSLHTLGLLNYYPVLIAIVYTFTLPEIIVGNLFTAWLSTISVLLAYVLVLRIGGTKKSAFLAGLMVAAYPSYLYFGSVLLKDTVVIPLVLAGILLILSMVKQHKEEFPVLMFATFFVILTMLIHLRFYVGYALLLSMLISWLLLSPYPLKKRMMYWLIMIVILGFSSSLAGNGYYGSDSFKRFLNPEKITYFREIVYGINSPLNPKPVTPIAVAPQPTIQNSSVQPSDTPKPSIPKPSTPKPSAPNPNPSTPPAPVPQTPPPPPVDIGSTFVLETGFNKGPIVFLKNSSLSFIYSLLGPFPWQFTKERQVVALAETIPWYLFIIVSLYGLSRFIKKNGIPKFLEYYKFSLPLLVFGILAIGALALYINNYGIIARIRIPMFICFVCVLSLSFNEKEYYEKVSYYWRRGIHWISSFAKTVILGK